MLASHRSVLLLLVVIVLSVAGLGREAPTSSPSAAVAASDDQLSQEVVDQHYLNCHDLPEITPDLPGAPLLEAGQQTDRNIMNCFAWQEFIALNWQVSADYPGKPDAAIAAGVFGEPGATTPVVWQTYKESRDVFLPNAAPPDIWAARPEIPDVCMRAAEDGGLDPASVSGAVHILEQTGQAGGTTADPHAWLTSQSGNVVRYEMRMNEVEFDYIVEHEYYNALKQYEAVQRALEEGGPGIYFPLGTPEKEGAIEIKAAWVELDNPGLANRYLTAHAFIYNPDQQEPACRVAMVGLVGLHIIQKSNDQWTWATFEHVQNAPSIDEIATLDLQDVFRFYDHACRFDCLPNRKPVPGQAMDKTIQVVRLKDVADIGSWGSFEDNLDSLNRWMQDQIRAANPDSVFQYYELIGIGWPEGEVKNDRVTTGPLAYENMVPESLANVVMETYFQQDGINCTSCHSAAHIAPSSADPNPQWRSDYSFILALADEPESSE